MTRRLQASIDVSPYDWKFAYGRGAPPPALVMRMQCVFQIDACQNGKDVSLNAADEDLQTVDPDDAYDGQRADQRDERRVVPPRAPALARQAVRQLGRRAHLLGAMRLMQMNPPKRL